MASVGKLMNWRPVAALALLALADGCGEKSDGVQIGGRVTYQGKAIGNGSLIFFPAQGTPVTTALAQDGAYECLLPAGEYRVAVAVGVVLPPGWKEGDPVPRQAVQLPEAYASRVKTPLTATVAADQSAAIDFSLE